MLRIVFGRDSLSPCLSGQSHSLHPTCDAIGMFRDAGAGQVEDLRAEHVEVPRQVARLEAATDSRQGGGHISPRPGIRLVQALQLRIGIADEISAPCTNPSHIATHQADELEDASPESLGRGNPLQRR